MNHLPFEGIQVSFPNNGYHFTIPGDPIAWMRPARSHRKIYDAQKSHKFAHGLYINQQLMDRPKITGPIHLSVIFYFEIPKSSLRNKSHPSRIGKWHISPPDESNCQKFIEDVAQGILYDNDCTICSVAAQKLYDSQPRTEIQVLSLR